MRVAVAGAAGMIGRALVDALRRDARVEEIVAIDVAPGPSAMARRPPGTIVRPVRSDIGDPGVADALRGADAVVHLAFRDHDVRNTVEANVAASRNLFAAAVGAGARTLVYGSSSAVYGSAADNPVGLREDAPLRPARFAYPLTKVAVEGALAELGQSSPQTRVVVLRPSWVLGPGARALLARRAFVSLSDHDPPVQATWIDDATSAFTAALHHEDVAGTFNIGAPGAVRASYIAGILEVRGIRLPYRVRRATAAASTWLRLPGALDPGFVDMDRYPIVVDSARAESELRWKPQHDTRAALERFRDTL